MLHPKIIINTNEKSSEDKASAPISCESNKKKHKCTEDTIVRGLM
jgi:hypothetical protein